MLVDYLQLHAVTVLANGGEGGAGAFDPKFAVFWTLAILIALAIILHKFAWPQILKVLDEREDRIRESLEAAERARAETEQIAEDHKRLVAEAREEALSIVTQGREAGDSIKDKIVADAKSEAKTLVERAKKEISLAEQKAISGIREAAVDLSLLAAGKVLGTIMDDGEHRKLAQEAVDSVVLLGRN